MKVSLIGSGALLAALRRGMSSSRHRSVGTIDGDRALVRMLRTAGVFSANGALFRRWVAAKGVDLVLVAGWGERLGPETLAVPPLGCVNCHPSLLPRHRGPNPYASAILAAEVRTGVTFHRMDRRLDTGPVLLQGEVGINSADTGGSLRDRCAARAAELVPELLDGLDAGTLIARPQDESGACYFPGLQREDGAIRWRDPARRIHDRIRGTQPWLRCYATLGGRIVSVGWSRVEAVERRPRPPGLVLESGPEGALVATGDPGRALRIRDLRLAGDGVRRCGRQIVPRCRPGTRFHAG